MYIRRCRQWILRNGWRTRGGVGGKDVASFRVFHNEGRSAIDLVHSYLGHDPRNHYQTTLFSDSLNAQTIELRITATHMHTLAAAKGRQLGGCSMEPRFAEYRRINRRGYLHCRHDQVA